LFALTGLVLSARTHGFPPSFAIALVSLGSGYASYCMVAGNTRTFCALILVALLPLVWLYNPLSTNLDYIYKSELAQQIEKLDQGSERPLWVCYGEGKPNFWSPGSYGGLLVSTLGGRAMTGIQWPPAVDFWRALDPTRKYEKYYNDYAHVYLLYTNGDEVSFSSPGAQSLYVKIAPDNQVLKQIGAKYILAMDDAVNQIDINKYPLIYKSRDGFFSIFEIP
ncbi:MAG TPA: hypothetical protein VEZ90_19065, partial [Blastocatellia bacterium]|nr:hypothetical protein [Blastocatellia bacterium]